MIDLNKISLTGNLIADPEAHQAGGASVTRSRLIHTESFKDRDSGEWKQGEPMAGDIEIRNAYGEAFAKVAKKGTAVLIDGKLRPNNYEREDGTGVFGEERVGWTRAAPHAGEVRSGRKFPAASSPSPGWWYSHVPGPAAAFQRWAERGRFFGEC